LNRLFHEESLTASAIAVHTPQIGGLSITRMNRRGIPWHDVLFRMVNPKPIDQAALALLFATASFAGEFLMPDVTRWQRIEKALCSTDHISGCPGRGSASPSSAAVAVPEPTTLTPAAT
jgi:hypothetical protein